MTSLSISGPLTALDALVEYITMSMASCAGMSHDGSGAPLKSGTTGTRSSGAFA